METFNKKLLKSELILHNISLNDLAKMLNRTKSTLSKKINGICDWKLFELQIIAKAVGEEKIINIFFS